jgi:hypothetical protein
MVAKKNKNPVRKKVKTLPVKSLTAATVKDVRGGRKVGGNLKWGDVELKRG